MSRIVIDEGRCKGCALCTHVCPHNLVRIATHFNSKGYQPAEYVDPEGACTACANCATMCPDLAITVYRSRRSRPADAQDRVQSQAVAPTPSNR
jgi:2-oxoglutarate ferredoxin oxidoreductase subunit delta